MSGVIFWSAVAFAAYVYAGYPVLIAALARLRPERRVDPDHAPALTVVIAAYDEEECIEAKLAETLALEYPAGLLQVVVAADGSSDRTVEIAEGFADRGVLVLHRPERLGKMAAIERAVAHASGEIVVFSDANNSYHSTALRAMAAPFCDPAVGVVVGRKTVLGDDGLGYSEGLYWRYEAAIRRWETRLGSCTGVNGEIIAVRRALFAPAPPGTINDDAWLGQRALRLGFRVAYAHDAVSSEPVSATARDEIDRRTRMVAGQFQQIFAVGDLPWRRPVAMWQLASHKLARPLVPFAMLAALGATIAALVSPGSQTGAAAILTLAPPWNWAAFGAQIVFYALALAGRRLDGLAGRVAYVPRFLVDSNLAALRGFARYVRGGQSAAWEKVTRRTTARIEP